MTIARPALGRELPFRGDRGVVWPVGAVVNAWEGQDGLINLAGFATGIVESGSDKYLYESYKELIPDVESLNEIEKAVGAGDGSTETAGADQLKQWMSETRSEVKSLLGNRDISSLNELEQEIALIANGSAESVNAVELRQTVSKAKEDIRRQLWQVAKAGGIKGNYEGIPDKEKGWDYRAYERFKTFTEELQNKPDLGIDDAHTDYVRGRFDIAKAKVTALTHKEIEDSGTSFTVDQEELEKQMIENPGMSLREFKKFIDRS